MANNRENVNDKDDVLTLYNNLKDDGYEDLGTADEFRQKVADRSMSDQLYNNLKDDGYEDLGTADEFFSRLNPEEPEAKEDNGGIVMPDTSNNYVQPQFDAAQIAMPQQDKKSKLEKAVSDFVGGPQWRDKTVAVPGNNPYNGRTYGEVYDQVIQDFGKNINHPDVDPYAEARAQIMQAGITDDLNPDEADNLALQVREGYANKLAGANAQAMVSQLPDQVPNIDQLMDGMWYNRDLQGKLSHEAQRLGLSHENYVNFFMKPQLAKALSDRYGYDVDSAKHIAARLLSGEQHTMERVRQGEANDMIDRYAEPKIQEYFDRSLRNAENKFNEQMRVNDMAGNMLATGNEGRMMGTALNYYSNTDPAKIWEDIKPHIETLAKDIVDVDFIIEADKHAEEEGLDINQWLQNRVEPYLVSQIQATFERMALEREMPKNTMDYLIAEARTSIIGSLFNAALASKARRRMQAEALSRTEMGQGEYKPGFGARVAGGVSAMLPDMLYGGPFGITAKIATKPVQGMAQQLIADGIRPLIARMAQSSAQGALSLGAFEAVKGAGEGKGKARYDSFFDDDQRSAGEILSDIVSSSFEHGMSSAAMGATMIGGPIGQKLSNGRGLLANALGWGTQVGVDAAAATALNIPKLISGEVTLEDLGNEFAQNVGTFAALGLHHKAKEFASLAEGGRAWNGVTFTKKDIETLEGRYLQPLRKFITEVEDTQNRRGLLEQSSIGIDASQEQRDAINSAGAEMYRDLMHSYAVPRELKVKVAQALGMPIPEYALKPEVIELEKQATAKSIDLGWIDAMNYDYNKPGGVADKLRNGKAINDSELTLRLLFQDNEAFNQALKKQQAGEELTDQEQDLIATNQNRMNQLFREYAKEENGRLARLFEKEHDLEPGTMARMMRDAVEGKAVDNNLLNEYERMLRDYNRELDEAEAAKQAVEETPVEETPVAEVPATEAPVEEAPKVNRVADSAEAESPADNTGVESKPAAPPVNDEAQPDLTNRLTGTVMEVETIDGRKAYIVDGDPQNAYGLVSLVDEKGQPITIQDGNGYTINRFPPSFIKADGKGQLIINETKPEEAPKEEAPKTETTKTEDVSNTDQVPEEKPASRIKTTEDGTELWEEAPVEDAAAELRDRAGDDAVTIVDEQIADVESQLKELTKPGKGKKHMTMSERLGMKQAIKDGQKSLEFWNQVKAELEKPAETVEEPQPAAEPKAEDQKPVTPPAEPAKPIEPAQPAGPTAEQKIAQGTVKNNIGKRFGFQNQDGTHSEVTIDVFKGDDKVVVTRQDYDKDDHPTGEPYSQELNLVDVGNSIVNGVMKPALTTKEKLGKVFKYTVGRVKLIDVLTEPEQQQLLDLYKAGDMDAVGALTGDLIDAHHEDLILKGRDERNDKVSQILNGNAGREEKLRRIRQLYNPDIVEGYLSDEALYPSSAEEWVAELNSRVPKKGEGPLAYFSYEKDGSKIVGMQDETGFGNKNGGDNDGFAPWLAPQGKGMSLQKYGELLHSQLPEAVQEQYTDQDMRNAVRDVFGGAERPSDITTMVIRRGIIQAENAARRQEEMWIDGGPNMHKVSADDNSFVGRLTRAKQQTNTEPTEAQKEKGNYKKGHVSFGGYDFVVENPEGSMRRGEADGKKWEQKMNNTYGYILGKYGKDGDHLDMFINDAADLDNWNGKVFVVDQVNPKTGEFDEHKVMYGFDSEAEARDAYLSNYEKGWKGLGKITGVDKETFDSWLDSSKRKRIPFAEHSIPKEALAKQEKKPVTDAEIDKALMQEVMKAPAEKGVQFVTDVEEGQKVVDDYNNSGQLKRMAVRKNIENGIDALQKIADGEESVPNAMTRDDLSQYGGDNNITFYYGSTGNPEKNFKGGYGIAHIGGKHGADTLLRVLKVIADGKIDRYVPGNKTVVLTDGEYEAVLALTRFGEKETWLFNGWKKDEKTGADGEVSTHSDATQANPTFSREDLGAVLSDAKVRNNMENDVKKDENLSEYVDFHKVSKPIFRSNAEIAVDGIKQEKATPEQWLAMLQKNGGLKAGEDKWLGLSDWLKEQKGSVTKQDILDYIRQNQIEVEEVPYQEYFDVDNLPKMQEFRKEFDELVSMYENRKATVEKEMETFGPEMSEKYGYGWVNKLEGKDLERYNDIYDRYEKLTTNATRELAFQDMVDRHGDDFSMAFEVNYGNGKLEPKMDMYGDEISDAAKHFLEFDVQPINSTRLSYTTDGLENKKEIALTVPTIEPYNESDSIHFGDADGGRAVAWIRFGDTVISDDGSGKHQAASRRMKAYNDYLADKYGFDSRNPLSFDVTKLTPEEIAESDRLAAEYEKTFNESVKKVLVIDEIQSKRHQDARELGYQGEFTDSPKKQYEVAYDKLMEYKQELDEKYGEYHLLDQLTPEERAKYEEMYQKVVALSEVKDDKVYTVPDAPFEKNWHELAMKRMLRYAAENGYDKIAWTTGEQQADRYNIGNALEEIYTDVPENSEDKRRFIAVTGKDRQLYTMRVNSDGSLSSSSSMFDGQNINDVFGKELSNRILNAERKTRIKDEGLRIGADGMKGFYDEILPRFINKYGKKWGVKVGEVQLPGLENSQEGLTMHSVDVTPEMKESVMEGQPMFFKTPDGHAYGFTYQGKIYIDPRIATAETPIHEYGHLWAEMKRQTSPEEWNHIKDVLLRDELVQPFIDKVKREYPELEGKDDAFVEEVLTQFSGKHGAEKLRKMAEEIKQELGDDAMAETIAQAAIRKVKSILNDFWKGVADMMGWKYTNAEDVADAVLRDMLNGVNPTERMKETPKETAGYYRKSKWKDSEEVIADLSEPSQSDAVSDASKPQAPNDNGREPINAETQNSSSDGKVTDNIREKQEKTEKSASEAQENEDNSLNFREGEAQQVELGAKQRKLTPRQMRERQAYAERQWRRAHEWADDTVKKLKIGDKVTIVDSIDELEGYEKFPARKKNAKGWYDPETDSIVIVMGNHRSPTDVVKTILHEAVAHHGLRKLFGSNYDTFLDNAYKSATKEIRDSIDELTNKYDGDVRKATEEYMGKLAEDTEFENAEKRSWVRHWFNQVKQAFLDMLKSLGLKDYDGVAGDISDNELRYILWRSYKNLTEPGAYRNVFQQAEDIAMRNKLAKEVKLPVKGRIEDEIPQMLRNHNDEIAIQKRVSQMSLQEAQEAYKRIDDMMRDEQGRDLDEQFEAHKQEYREKNGLNGIGKFVADDLKQAMDKYGSGMVELRWELADRIEELGGSTVPGDGKELYRDGEEEGPRFQRVSNPEPELTDEQRQYWKQWDAAMKKWKERNALPLDAQEPGEETPKQPDEAMMDYVLRIAKHRMDKALWNTAPKLEDYMQVRTDKDSIEAARENLERYPESPSAKMRVIAAEAQRLRHAMSRQKAYDKATVKAVTDFAQEYMKLGFGDNMRRSEVERLLSSVKNATGAKDIRSQVDNIMNILTDNYLRSLDQQVTKLSSVKELRQTAQGVEHQGKLELKGQRMIQAFREARQERMTAEDIRQRIGEVSEYMARNDEEAPMWEQEYEGLSIALQYAENIDASRSEYKELDNEYRDAVKNYKQSGRTYQQQQQYLDTLEKAMMENKLERIGMFGDIIGRLEGNIAESMIGAREFVEREKERVRHIQQIANFDLAGMDMGAMRENSKGKPANFFLQPLATFEQMLKQFGGRNANGEGYLYNYFMRNWADATDKAFLGEQAAKEELDEKAREVFGDNIKRWSDLYKLIRNEKEFPGMDVELLDQEEPKTFHLTQGNLMYIYMANKMNDGAMKLRKMGITEEDVAAIKEHLDNRLVQLADWLQEEYLPQKRIAYNKVHERMFGAPMATIENYYPIRVLGDARYQEQDVNVPDSETLPSTITGNIIKRRKNTLPLDILHTDALSLAVEHIEDMERWAATAEWNKDVNTLLSYTTFRNKVKNMKTIYGSGDALWNSFKDAARMAAGVYNPSTKSGHVDKTISNIAKGVTAAKISFRMYTAFKQILSAPAFLHDVNLADFAKNAVNPYGSWKWAMENMPMFQKRWKSRQAGDTRLMDDPTDWKMWKENIVQLAARMGMTPNALVDGVTCAVGARSIYESRIKRYKEMGLSDEDAEKRAIQDAEIGYNLTQQSSEGAFVSAIQKDRTVAANMLSVFRNSSMSYTRQWVDAVRNLKNRTQPGYKEDSIKFMERQFMDEFNMDEEQAQEYAEAEYARAGRHDIARLMNMAFGVTIAWNLGASLPYLLIGDDWDTKKEMMTDALLKGLAAGPSEGFAAGNIISELIGRSIASEETRKTFQKEGLGAAADAAIKQAGDYEVNPLPLFADIQGMIKKMGYDKFAAIQDVFNIVMQSAVGVNPQTFTDVFNAVMDYAAPGWDGTDYKWNPENMLRAKELALFLMRLTNAPTSSWRNKYIDELELDADEAQKLTYDEMAKRYAHYKHWKDNPFMGWLRGEAGREKKMQSIRKQFDKAVQERMDRLAEEDILKTYDQTDDRSLMDMIGKNVSKRIGGKDLIGKSTSKKPEVQASVDYYVRNRTGADLMEDLQLEAFRRKVQADVNDDKATQEELDVAKEMENTIKSIKKERDQMKPGEENKAQWENIRKMRKEMLDKIAKIK